MEILEPKRTISKIKNSLARLNRFEMTEVSRCESIKRNYGIWKQKKKKTLKKIEQFCDLWDSTKRSNIHATGISE